MKNLNAKLVLVMLVAILILAGCSPADTNGSGDEPQEEPERTFTEEELSQYNGKDGNPAYVAVDGVVYDFTELELWVNGEHNGFEAGQDLTEEIKDISPHGLSVLDRATVVGTLEE